MKLSAGVRLGSHIRDPLGLNYLAIPLKLDVSYQDSPILICHTDYQRSKYVDEAIIPGDKIEVVAYFDFSPKEEPYDPEDPECGLYVVADNAHIESILIWKP